MLHDYGKGLAAQFWVGIERQGPLEMDPRLIDSAVPGPPGLDGDGSRRRVLNARELREFALESYRHFASRRALSQLDSRQRVA